MRLAFALLALSLAFIAPAAAQEKWVSYRDPAQSFAVQFPGPPKVTSAQLTGKFPLTHHQYQFFGDHRVYNVSVMEFTKGSPDTSGPVYLAHLIASYAKGSGTTLLTQTIATVADHPAMEAVTVDPAHDRYNLIDVLTSGPRVYLLASEGPKGHETSVEAKRFRSSFKLLER
jgi:hypothetical protein